MLLKDTFMGEKGAKMPKIEVSNINDPIVDGFFSVNPYFLH